MQFAILVLFAITAVSAALECYEGFIPTRHYSELLVTPSLSQCHDHAQCCFKSSTLGGRDYRCKTDCPRFEDGNEVHEPFSIEDGGVTYCKSAEGSCAFNG